MLSVSYEININKSQRELFDFHIDINNLRQVIPGFINLNIQKISSQEYLLEFKLLNILKLPSWTVIFLDIQEPEYFIDSTRNNLIFTEFNHKHIFQDNKLQDIIQYKTRYKLIDYLAWPMLKLALIAKLLVTKVCLENKWGR